MMDIQFLVVPCKIVYKFILGRPSIAALDAILTNVYLQIKYHKANANLFNISLKKILGIDSNVACHQPNIDPSTMDVAERERDVLD